MPENDDKNKLALWAQIRHFTPKEFDSPDAPGSGIKMNLEFVKLLDQGREKTGFVWKINSGVRTVEHNDEVGGKGPEHCNGNAADIQAITSQEKFAIVQWAMSIGIKRIGIAKNYVHLGFDFTLPQDVIWTYYP